MEAAHIPPPASPNPDGGQEQVSGEAYRLRPGKLLGDVIVELGFARRVDVEGAVVAARGSGKRMGDVLIERGILTSDDLANAVAARFGLPRLNLDGQRVDVAAANLLDIDVARRLQSLPVGFGAGDTLIVAMVEPSNVLAVDDISMITGRAVRPAIVSSDEFNVLISQVSQLETAVSEVTEQAEDVLGTQPPDEDGSESAAATEGDAPAVRLVRSIIAEAIQRRASDIHLEPIDGAIRVRFRIDGVVHVASTIPSNMAPAVISRIKVISDLDIAERRIPQDGRVGLSVEGRKVDLRVVTVPLVNGESVVLRILDSGGELLRLDEVGMEEDDRAKLIKAITSANGGILTTGPTGSGKTTTLYGCLAEILSDDLTIMTIEDPVEYRLAGVKQMQINAKTGLTFGTGLKAAMRADPDVIMVGEIRDPESANIAVQAAITGHLVLSTLHTNNAATTVTRLSEMGVPPYLVASAITCVVGQRLTRRLCPECRRPATVPASSVGMPGDQPVTIYEPGGCNACGNAGYRGRVGLYEVLEMTERLRRLTVENADADTIARAAVEEGMRTMREDGLSKVRAGLTSISEVQRVTSGH
ncbi:MAG: Flp pilus assembly complex ATPase component TadA [Solirubrobacteraceae bacterium]|nr:Flp pilus assembly complex ATPase component TadA [Solirubrobacteraceae bacterium]